MNYEKIYEDYYSKSFDRIELLIKNFFIKRRSQKRIFINSINEVTQYFNTDFKKKNIVYNNENLKALKQIFCKRHSIYFIDEVQEIFENQIKIEFDKINASELPTNYTYLKFIKEIALIEAAKEISRLLSNNLQLLKMFYELNEFDEFEIREQGNLSLEDYPIFKKLHRELYPDCYMYNLENENLVMIPTEMDDYKGKKPFKIGLKFATGEPQELYKKYKNEKGHFKIICLELGFEKTDRPYFSETLPNTSVSSKNLFNNTTLLKKIARHCNEFKVVMCEDFLEKIKLIELE
jgi:hypothetical protein